MSLGEDPGDTPGVSWLTPDGWRHNPVQRGGPKPPVPDYYTSNPHLLAGEAYYLSTSGCKHACKYCQWATQGLRGKSPEQVVAELEAILASESVHTINFMDHDLVSVCQDDRETMARMIAVLQTRPEVIVRFLTNPGNLGSAELSKLIDALQVIGVGVGVQSMSPAVLNAVNRGWAVAQIEDLETTPEGLRRHIVIELVYPLPEETPETFFQGLDRLVRMGYGRFQIFPLVVLRGTELYRDSERWGLEFMADPPRYVLETATFPAAAMREACGVAWVLALLNELNGTESQDVDALAAWVRATPGLIGELRIRVRDGIPLDRILGDLMEAIHGDSFVGRDAVEDFLAIEGRNEILASPSNRGVTDATTTSAPPASRLLRDAFPPSGALREVLAGAGAVVAEEIIGDDGLTVRIRHGDEIVDLQIFGADDPRLYYKVAGEYKVAYSGSLGDIGIVDTLVRFLEDQ